MKNQSKTNYNNRRGGFKKSKPENIVMEMNLYSRGVTYKREYNKDSLVDILASVPFKNISVPVYAEKSAVYGDDTKRGAIIIGYVNSFDASIENFEITIFAKFGEFVKNLHNSRVFANVIINRETNDVDTIVSLKVVSSDEVDAYPVK